MKVEKFTPRTVKESPDSFTSFLDKLIEVQNRAESTNPQKYYEMLATRNTKKAEDIDTLRNKNATTQKIINEIQANPLRFHDIISDNIEDIHKYGVDVGELRRDYREFIRAAPARPVVPPRPAVAPVGPPPRPARPAVPVIPVAPAVRPVGPPPPPPLVTAAPLVVTTIPVTRTTPPVVTAPTIPVTTAPTLIIPPPPVVTAPTVTTPPVVTTTAPVVTTAAPTVTTPPVVTTTAPTVTTPPVVTTTIPVTTAPTIPVTTAPTVVTTTAPTVVTTTPPVVTTTAPNIPVTTAPTVVTTTPRPMPFKNPDDIPDTIPNFTFSLNPGKSAREHYLNKRPINADIQRFIDDAGITDESDILALVPSNLWKTGGNDKESNYEKYITKKGIAQFEKIINLRHDLLTSNTIPKNVKDGIPNDVAEMQNIIAKHKAAPPKTGKGLGKVHKLGKELTTKGIKPVKLFDTKKMNEIHKIINELQTLEEIAETLEMVGDKLNTNEKTFLLRRLQNGGRLKRPKIVDTILPGPISEYV